MSVVVGHVSKIGNGNVYNQPEVVTQRDFSGRNIGFHNEHITYNRFTVIGKGW